MLKTTRLLAVAIGLIVVGVALMAFAFQRSGETSATSLFTAAVPPAKGSSYPICPPCAATQHHVTFHRNVMTNPQNSPHERGDNATTTEAAGASLDPNDAFPEFHIPFDTLQCKKIYLDCGSNHGEQLMKLYDGYKPKALGHKSFGSTLEVAYRSARKMFARLRGSRIDCI